MGQNKDAQSSRRYGISANCAQSISKPGDFIDLSDPSTKNTLKTQIDTRHLQKSVSEPVSQSGHWPWPRVSVPCCMFTQSTQHSPESQTLTSIFLISKQKISSTEVNTWRKDNIVFRVFNRCCMCSCFLWNADYRSMCWINNHSRYIFFLVL